MLFIFIGIAIIGIFVTLGAMLLPTDSANSKKCRHCAKRVKIEDVVCKHCKKDLVDLPYRK